MKIGIITAMDEECKLYHDNLEVEEEYQRSSMTFFKAKKNNKEIIFVKCGIGKVNASVCTQVLIDDFKVEKIICTGVAGSLNRDLKIGDVVVSEECAHHDINLNFLGYPRGHIPYTDYRFFKADKELVELGIKTKLDVKVVKGRVLTGDQFVNDEKLIEEIKKDLNGDCVEMEGAAVAQVCVMNKKDFVVIRSLSDDANHEAPSNFQEFLTKASKNAYKVVMNILERLK